MYAQWCVSGPSRFPPTHYPWICQLRRFDQYFQGRTGLPEAYVIILFQSIEVSISFEGVFVYCHSCLPVRRV
jgi:hypothetical protein